VKKAKAKKQPRKKTAPRKTTKKADRSLQTRLEAEFSEALKRARSYIDQPERLCTLVGEAARKAASMPKEQFKETWAYFQAMLRLMRAYYRGDYRQVSPTTLVVIIAAIVYIVNPFDLIPDFVPGLGLLDDAIVLAFAVQRTRRALDDFMTWETATL